MKNNKKDIFRLYKLFIKLYIYIFILLNYLYYKLKLKKIQYILGMLYF